MKIITTIDHTDKTWDSILLETAEDVNIYASINAQIKARQAVGFWMGFKSQTYRQDPSDYVCHEVESNNNIAQILALNMNARAILQGNPKTSLIDFCNDADKIIEGIHSNMHRFILQGKLVRVNNKGGYCPILIEEENITNSYPINEQELYNYIINGAIDKVLKITSETVLIENGNYIPDTFIKQYCNITGQSLESIQIITSFKYKTILFTKTDWFNFFKGDIRPKNLIFQTTAQDQRQIRNLKEVIEKLNLDLNIYIGIRKWVKDRSMFETENSKINITFIEN